MEKTYQNIIVASREKLQSTTIWEAHDYLGPYSLKLLNVGNNQFMSFQPGDEGPFWMTADE